DLRGGVIAVVQVHHGAVGGAAPVDVHALAERVQGAARLDDGPLLRVGAVAGVHLDGGEVGGVRAADVDAQALVAGDRAPAAAGTATAAAAAPAGRISGDVGHAHRAARRGRAGRRGAAADAVREAAAHRQVEDDRQVVVVCRLPGRRAHLGLAHAEVLVTVQVEGDRLVGGIGPVQDHRVRVVAALAAAA